jgi:hypothetical protein
MRSIAVCVLNLLGQLTFRLIGILLLREVALCRFHCASISDKALLRCMELGSRSSRPPAFRWQAKAASG